MTEYLVKQQNHVFYKFYLPLTREDEQNIFWLNKRLPTLKYLSEKMIKENETNLNTLLTELITDKFGYENNCDPKAHCS